MNANLVSIKLSGEKVYDYLVKEDVEVGDTIAIKTKKGNELLAEVLGVKEVSTKDYRGYKYAEVADYAE